MQWTYEGEVLEHSALADTNPSSIWFQPFLLMVVENFPKCLVGEGIFSSYLQRFANTGSSLPSTYCFTNA